MAFEWTGFLKIWNENTDGDQIVDGNATVSFDPSTGRLTAVTSEKTVEGDIVHSRPDPIKDPMFLSCNLDDGTPTHWSLWGMTDSERQALAAAYSEGLL